MTTLTLNIKDDSKVQDVLRFLSDIDFLEVKEADEKNVVQTSGIFNFQSIDLGWSRNSMTRDEMNARGFFSLQGSGLSRYEYFIYAIDSHDIRKHQIAKSLVDSLLSRRLGFYSAQVMSEWRNVMVRKYSDKVSVDFRMSFLRWLLGRQLVPVTGDLIVRAEELSSKYCFSAYDSMHIQAALDLGCRYFLSEDMQDGLMVNDQLEIINPFVGILGVWFIACDRMNPAEQDSY